MFQKMLKSFFVHFGVLNVSNDTKHTVFFFVWFHKMVSPQNGETLGGSPPPPILSDAANPWFKNKRISL